MAGLAAARWNGPRRHSGHRGGGGADDPARTRQATARSRFGGPAQLYRQQLVLAFRAKLFRHLQRLSLSYHDAAGTAAVTYHMQYDAPAIQWITIDALIPLLSSLLPL